MNRDRQPMRYFSVCSGIEAATVAWRPMGWEATAFSEIEKFPSAVLDHHYPDVTNLGDMCAIKGDDYRGSVDLLVGGTPCQSFSLAGLRGGLDDPRGQLTLAYFRLAGRMRPRWLVWENVPGVLSDDGGRTFGSFLGALAELGYGFAYRILDAQYFGVPQRRRRVYLVGYLGDWRPPAAVLFERHSLSGDSPPSRGQREDIAETLTDRSGRNGWAADGRRIIGSAVVAPSMCAGAPFSRTGNSWVECEALVTQALTCRLGSGGPDDNKAQGRFYIAYGGHHYSEAVDVSATIKTNTGRSQDYESETFIAHTISLRGREGGSTAEMSGDLANCLQSADGGGNKPHVLTQSAVRRLTPTECERLQGFPDDYTLIPWRGKPAADGPRYKSLGNSMAVPVMRWIGERIDRVETILQAHGPEEKR